MAALGICAAGGVATGWPLAAQAQWQKELRIGDLFLAGGEASRTAGFEPEARALDVGFQNPSHFARMFRKFVGTSQSHFQNQK
jgi:hypothetical protein